MVAGGTGFIGSSLVARLLSLGAEVRATAHERRPAVADERVEYVKCDLTRAEDCREAVRGAEVVFMCAANTSGAAVMASTPLVHVTPNLVMNARMLEAAYHERVGKFVWLSSNAAYPPSGSRPVREEEFFEGDPYETYFGVGWMKRYTEILCRMYAEKLKEPMTTVVLRPSNVYGPGDNFDPRTSHVTAALVRKVAERQDPLAVWGTGEDVRDIVYIDDMVDAIILATEKLDGYQPVNVASGEGHTVREVLRMLLEMEGFDPEVVYDPSKPSMIPVRLIDTARARRLLGFSARVGVRDGLRRTLEWYKRRGADPAPR